MKLLLSLLVAAILQPLSCLALSEPEADLAQVGVVNHLGQKIDLNAQFTDSRGQATTIGSLVRKDRPAIIVPAYYQCPRLCGLVLEGVKKLLNSINLTLGKDFTVITVSFDETDTAETALNREGFIKGGLASGVDASGWHFLFGSKENVSQLMETLGFRYKRDGDDFSHSAAIFFVTPQGEVSQYFAGIDFDPKSTRAALVDASRGTIGTVFDQVFLFCFRYDHMQGKYVWVAFNIMRTGGLLTLSFLAILIYRLWRRERLNKTPATL